LLRKAILPLVPGKAALAGSNAATAATPHATNTAKATEATNNTVLLLAKGFVALKKSFVAIFSPQLFFRKSNKAATAFVGGSRLHHWLHSSSGAQYVG
jgi:uncharacterized membrane protein YjjB (DUF3815 family)